MNATRDRTTGSSVKQRLGHAASLVWWHLPFRRRARQKIKDVVFGRFGLLFGNTAHYRSWREARMLFGREAGKYEPVIPPGWPALEKNTTLIAVRPTPAAVDPRPVTSLAVVIHAYHVDLLDEIVQWLGGAAATGCKLFVSGSARNADAAMKRLNLSGYAFEYTSVGNRGRDIFPFLKSARTAMQQGFRLLLKAHTKKTDRRGPGFRWRKEAYSALLPPAARDRAAALFNEYHDIGMLGPAGHIVPMNLYIGGNAGGLGYLCRRLGVDPRVLDGMGFVAGSMFFIRREALLPLVGLDLLDTMFEEETGQQDGTMAHAVERAFAVSTFAAGMRLVDSGYHRSRRDPELADDHPFTW